MNDLAARAAQLFPRSPEMQRRWIAAKLHAQRLTKHFATLMPLTERDIPENVMAARTTREAGL